MLNMSENCQPSGKVFIAKSFSKNKFDRKKNDSTTNIKKLNIFRESYISFKNINLIFLISENKTDILQLYIT